MDDDQQQETPGVVVGAIALGVAPLPFLFFYAVLFVAHGLMRNSPPPDITSSWSGELVSGGVAFVGFCVLTLSLWWFMNRRRRWLFVLGQLLALGTAIDFVVDSTIGARGVSLLLAVAALAATVLALTPVSARYAGSLT
jgi:hypothetical protein